MEIKQQKRMKTNNIFHVFIHDILKEYYHVMAPEYTATYYMMPETIRLYDTIRNKLSGSEFVLFNEVIIKLRDKYPDADFIYIDDRKPSHTGILKIAGVDGDQLEVYFSMSILGKCYCFFIKAMGQMGNSIYFAPQFEYTELYQDLDNLFKEALPDYIDLPYNILKYQLRFVVPGKNHSSKGTGQPTSSATVFDAMFFDFEFSDKYTISSGPSGFKKEQFLKLDKHDVGLWERFKFFGEKQVSRKVIMDE